MNAPLSVVWSVLRFVFSDYGQLEAEVGKYLISKYGN
jgi:hypothetical protein